MNEALPKDLDADQLDPALPDLSIAPQTELAIARALRTEMVNAYHQLKLQARLDDVVENTRSAEQRRETMKKIVQQVAALDIILRDIE